MAWIESHQTLRDHRKTLKMVGLLHGSKLEVIGSLHCLWWWALDNTPSGFVASDDVGLLALGAEWPGPSEEYTAALVGSGFLDREEGGYKLHDWDEYTAKWFERRASNAARMRETRARGKDHTKEERATHVQRTDGARDEHVPRVPNLTGPDHTMRSSSFFSPVVGREEAHVQCTWDARDEKKKDFEEKGTTQGGTTERPAVDEVSVERLVKALRREYLGERPPNGRELEDFRHAAVELAASEIRPEDVGRLRAAIHAANPKYPDVPAFALARHTYLLPKPIAQAAPLPEEMHGPPASPEVAEKFLAEMRGRARFVAKPIAPVASAPAVANPEVIEDRGTIARRAYAREQFLRQAQAFGGDDEPTS